MTCESPPNSSSLRMKRGSDIKAALLETFMCRSSPENLVQTKILIAQVWGRAPRLHFRQAPWVLPTLLGADPTLSSKDWTSFEVSGCSKILGELSRFLAWEQSDVTWNDDPMTKHFQTFSSKVQSDSLPL